MASRTQLRLAQLTGSAVDIKSEAQQYVTAHTSAITGSDLNDVFGMIGAALNRIHGAASDEPFNSAEGTFATSVFDVNSTGNITIDSSGGTISLGADADAENMNIGTGAAARTITIGNVTGATALALNAGTGGVAVASTGAGDITLNSDDTLLIDADGVLELNSSGGAISIGNDADAQDINIGIGAAARTITIGNTTGATKLDVDLGTGGLDVDVTNGPIALDTTNTGTGITIGTVTSGVPISIGHAESEVTINDNLTITGDLTVSGDTTTVSTSNLAIKDSIIGIGFSGSNPSTAGDRALLFGRGAMGSKLPGLYYDGTDFKLAATATDIASGSIVGTPSAGDYSIFRAGRILSENTTDATSTTNGALQTDGGLSVALDAVFGNDAHLLSNGAVLNIGNAQKFILTHQNADNTATVTTNHRLAFGDAGEYITGDTNDLKLVSGQDITLDATVNINLDLPGAAGAPSGSVNFKSNGTLYGIISASMSGETKGMIISSSEGGTLNYDSNSGNHMFDKQGTNIATLSLDEDGEIKFGSSFATDLQFVDDQMEGANEVFRIDVSAKALAMPTQNAAGDDDTGILTFNGTTNVQQAIYSDGTRLFLRSGNKNFGLPVAVGSADQVLTTDGNASPTLTWQGVSTLVAPDKGIKIVTASHAAGGELKIGSGEVDAGDAIIGLSQAESQGATLDVFVNGQLLVSGSTSERTAGTRDYEVQPAGNSLKFAFDLEADDVVQIVKR